MTSKLRIVTLIVVPVALILALVLGSFLRISPAHIVHASTAIHQNPDLSSCTRGLGCDNKNPSQYQSSNGSCTAGSSNQGSSSFSSGTITLYYNWNCDI